MRLAGMQRSRHLNRQLRLVDVLRQRSDQAALRLDDVVGLIQRMVGGLEGFEEASVPLR